MAITWDIRNEGHAFGPGEVRQRYDALGECNWSVLRGKLFFSDEQRLIVLGMLLENLGADAAVRLGDAAVWRAAVAKLDQPG